jgi:cyclophilin family peptidyl-prolyl cis-trans isomerase
MADSPINSKTNYEVVTDSNGVTLRRSIAHLPAFYRTDTNQKFLSSTLDQLIQPGSLTRLDGYIGRTYAYTRLPTDKYVSATSEDRINYQLEPAVTYTDKDTSSINPEDQVKFTATYDDYVNQIKFFGGNVDNHDRLNKETVYAWNPAIDFDKLINYREYYWMPEGPNPILVTNVGTNTVTEIKVDHVGQSAYTFSTYGDTANPSLTLYRGNTYKFVLDTAGHPFYIMTEPFKTGLAEDDSTSVIYSSGVSGNGTEIGTVSFTVPTNAPDVLYYQCGNHEAMHGIFTVRTVTATTKIDVAHEIVGTKNYTLSTGTVLSNGMKVRFGSNVLDSEYSNREFYVEGVGNAITLTDTTKLITPESYAVETTELYDSVAYDTRPYAISFYRPETPDYITIKRDSIDGNAWSRYNRWFHRAVIEATATANGYTPNLLETDRAKRPIIEFDSGLRLYNHGTEAKRSVTLVDTTTTDVFSNIVNRTSYIIDGISLLNGMRVLFTADTDTLVKNKIYKVNFVTVGSTRVINLTEESDAAPQDGEAVFVELGTTNQGKTFYYSADDLIWTTGQNKTALNQQPLFSMYDNDHVSFDDNTVYPDSTFAGANIFAYKISSAATVDTVLGLKVKYNTINNVGDIVFESDFASGSFTYNTGENFISKNFGTGHVHYTTSRTAHNSKTGWIKQSQQSRQRVIRTFTVDANELRLFPVDVYANSAALTDLEVSVDVNHINQNLDIDYNLVDGTTNKYIKFTKDLAIDDIVKIQCYSSAKKVAGKGLYEVPENLAVNPFNEQLAEFTFGQIMNHVHDINEKNTDLIGTIPGSCNLRDLPDVRINGGTILQHSAPLPQALFLMIDQNSNAINAIDYCGLEYQKFKENFLSQASATAYEGTAAERVDEIIGIIAGDKGKSFPFFYEDMIGYGKNVSTRTYTVQDSTETQYAINSQFNITEPSSRAVYVYLNDTLLLLGEDYTFSSTDDSVTIIAALTEGDTITVKDYSDTTGSFIPSTPTKLGIYPKFKPELVTDNTYITATSVIVGHDGSRTVAYGDYRDNLLLELEKRIYNNCKTAYDSTLLPESEVRPSAFQTGDYTLTEIDNILSLDFYAWAGRNAVDYQKNDTYDQSDEFTFNYSSNKDIVNGEYLLGHWRGIYKHFYDTDRPHTHPWEMLGYSEIPAWWEGTYGPAPYTAGNTLLWNDLASGYDHGLEEAVTRYIRVGLLDHLPVDESGNLVSPIDTGLIDRYTQVGTNKKWKFGDQGPAETAWRKSAQYPFAVTKLLALTRPAKFFGLFLDNSRLTTQETGNVVDTETELAQSLRSAKYHLETVTDTVTGAVTRYTTAGYQPWVVNYLIKNGLDPAVFFYDKMKNLNVQLIYKLGGFTDKQNLKILTDSISPGSTSGSQFIPTENYKILFRSSNPIKTFEYSGVLIELNPNTTNDGSTLEGGYKVIGYNTIRPYFRVFEPSKNGNSYTVEAGNARATVYKNWKETEKVVTYGTVFKDVQSVVDFLVGYGKYLESEGFVFDNFSNELQETANWEMSAREFLYWTRQGWALGSAITLSPGASAFQLNTTDSVIGRLQNLQGEYTVLDSGGRAIDKKLISTKRVGTTFEIQSKNPEIGIYNASFNAVQKEHVLIFDNATVFSDILLQLGTGFRQQRLKLIGWKTGDWNGDYYSPGFIFDEARVNIWTANTDYQIGDTVEHNARFYVSKNNHNSGNTFVSDNWKKKDNKPAAQLIPNFDYKISQFNDFYNLESNNFDEGQQKLAQHLTGYQSRDYLENLFVNDISQYKFYQGFIREKGTLNAIDKLVKAKFYDEDISLNVYPEWMIKTGEFGNVDGHKAVQIRMPDEQFTSNIQSIEILDNATDSANWIKSATVVKEALYQKPIEYTAAETFSRYDYSLAGFDRDVAQKFKTAGFPRLADVQHTAFNESSLLNLDVTKLTTNDLVWIAKKDNNDWDVQRVSNTGLRITSITAINNNTQLEITFTGTHSFQKNDYFSIVNSQYDTLNAVYQVAMSSADNSVIFDFDRANIITTITGRTLADGSTLETYGNVYKFVSVRLATMNNVNDRLSYRDYRDANETIETNGDRVFADNTTGLWKIYEKVDPYETRLLESPDTTSNQDFGFSIVARNDGRTLIVSAPTKGQGTIHFFARRENTAGTAYTINSSVTMTDNNDDTARLGESLSISTDENFVIAGAPYNNNLASDGSTRNLDVGLIKVFVWNDTANTYGLLNTIVPPVSDDSTVLTALNFGWAHAMAELTELSTRTTTPKYLFVSAPGYSSDSGIVYMYSWIPTVDGSTTNTWYQEKSITSNDAGSGKRFGHRIAINDSGDILAISSVSPGTAGQVEIFTRNSVINDGSSQHFFTYRQTIKGVSADGSTVNTAFGDAITMSKDGTTLAISAPGLDNGEQDDAGAVYIYKWNADASTNTFTLQQTISAPEADTNMRFGSSLQLNAAANRLVIGAEKYSNKRAIRFDNGTTTFDLQDTRIVDLNIGSGGVFTATKYDTQFVIDDKLVTNSVSTNDNFGKGVYVTDDTVFVGAPDDDTLEDDGSTFRTNDGSVTVFDLKAAGSYAWRELVSETALIDDRKIESAFIFDSAVNKIIDYLDYYDPIKGRILGIADREINYKTEWDPAIYNVGTAGKTISGNTAWGDEHIGEVWWDMSSVRWLWYEQNNQEYKTKNWGNLFPGSSVDIYEWVSSTLLPSEWNARTDTTGGLAQKISGTPLHPDNTVFTIKQKYDSRSDSFINVYYYWVKNSVFLPAINKSVTTRKNTTAYIANIITNPSASGIKYFSVSDTNSLITVNVKNSLINDNTVLNVNYRNNDNDADQHVIWKLIREGDKDDKPNERMEKKWWDSLIGQDVQGNEVPDLNLPLNQRYGNNIRPRQSWYVDRFAALKEIIDYTNSVLKANQLANSISYSNLNSSDPEPTAASGEWDSAVDTYADLTYIDTRDISGTTNVLIHSDEENSRGFWAIYNWTGTEFNRTKVQTYKTSAYYSLADWYDSTHDENTVIDEQVTYQYELDTLDLAVGKHVKVLQADTGGWKIFQQTTDGFINVATQNGTIQLSKTLYDYTINSTGFDGEDTFDGNFFDQTPTTETRKILTALRDDIFVGDLAVEYNNIFFTGLRKVLEEQLYVDWMSKTSFINVTNSLRPLDQRKTYRVGTDDYVESYINEVKPFHTKIREYKLGYTGVDTEDGINTDFDLPAFYDGTAIRNVDVDADTAIMATYPYRFWRDNYKKYVNTITVTDGGSGYITAPTVTLVGGTTGTVGPFAVLGQSNSGTTSGQSGYYYPLYTAKADADLADSKTGGTGSSSLFTFNEYAGVEFYMPTTGQNTAVTDRPTGYTVYSATDTTQATARAIISGGSVVRIQVLTPGSNYTATPRVVITGGGTSGTTPADAAKGYADLKNDLVRDITTTIKFDRVQSTATVLTWTAGTTYAYNDLIRYENELYKVITPFTSTEDFADGLAKLVKLRGDETYITAAERTLGLYTPASGMPGNELSQVMTGVDYGGVMVTGLAFSNDQGWDRSPWYNNPWDNYGTSRIKIFYGDGSSTAFTFDTAPVITDVYTVYINGERQTSLVFRGDGSTKTFSVIPDDSSVVGNGDKIEFIPFDDDRVLTPTDDRTLDSLVSGGLFGSVLGVAPSDIILEGDGFVTPETSYAPEENVPGSMFDTVDIKVYTSPESGVPFIINKNYIGNGSTATYSIGQIPGTQASVIVSVNELTKDITTDYTVDTLNKTITFTSVPAVNSKISIKNFAISGSNYIVLNNFTGDGSTSSFSTSSRETFQLDSAGSQLYITVDGAPTTNYTTSVVGKLITITFATSPAAGKSVQIAAFNQASGSGRAYAEIRSQQISYDGSTNRYTLTYPAGAIGPFSGLTLLELNGKILRGPDNSYYLGDGSTYSYGVISGLSEDSTVDPAKTITADSQIEVYVNGTKKYLYTDYTVNIATQTVEFVTPPTNIDIIAISTLVDNQYYNESNDIVLKPAQISADGITLTAGDTLTATTFNNAVGMNQRREVLEGRASGEFYLRFTPLNSDYVFVYLNGSALTQGFDFTLTGNKITVAGKTITTADRLDVMYFAVESAINATGFRIFKDMLNRTFYKRISMNNTTTLAATLTEDATSITVADGSRLSPVDGSTALPGVIFIDRERIEYFYKSGNTLSNLRRGTLGTGIRSYASGTAVTDSSGQQTVPYADTIYTKTNTADGSTTTFSTSLAAGSVYELDVFVGGRRLPYMSEDGSTVNYSVDGSTSSVTLATAPAAGTQVKVIQKRGQVWYTAADGNPSNGKGLQKSTTNQARFIAGEPTNAPE